MRRVLTGVILLTATPAFAQFKDIDVRPFVVAASERVAAQTTFNAVFSSATESVWGGGVDVVVRKKYFVDLAISRWSTSGQRAFLNNGDVFRLGIPVRLSSTPVELTGGYRFRFRMSRIIPYAGAGIGSYSYHEAADFAAPGDDVDVRHAGFVLLGGAEFRVGKWAGVSGDAAYTRVPGILGQGGISKDANESDFGGIAARIRVILGR
jgi:outer membrane protein W